MAKKNNVNLQLSEELSGIDAELELAMEALSSTNQRIDDFLNDDGEDEASGSKVGATPAAELTDEGEIVEELTDNAEEADADEDEEEYDDQDDEED